MPSAKTTARQTKPSNGRGGVIPSRHYRPADLRFLEPRIPAQDFISPHEWAEIAEVLGLSTAVWAVGMRWFEGAKPKAIAAELGRKPATVRNQLRRLYERLKVTNKTDFALRVLRVRELLRGGAAPS